jgi:hypothetical protein
MSLHVRKRSVFPLSPASGTMRRTQSMETTMRPNILVIMSDDQGPWAMGCAGNDEIKIAVIGAGSLGFTRKIRFAPALFSDSRKKDRFRPGDDLCPEPRYREP